MEAEAEAEAVALKGDAEAFAIECKAKAEAEQMAKKADAWKEYKEAAMVDMMLQTLPKVKCFAVFQCNNCEFSKRDFFCVLKNEYFFSSILPQFYS